MDSHRNADTDGSSQPHPRRKTMNKFVTRLCLTLIGAAALAALPALSPASARVAAPTPVTLHLDGTHPVAVDYHQGTFTAPPPLCPSGNWLGNGAGGRV